MIRISIGIALVALGAAIVLNLYRLLRGPHALDTLYVNSIALILLLGIAESTAVYFEAALTIAAVGFIGTAALAKFVSVGRVFR